MGRRTCSSNCEGGRQRALEPNEVAQLSADARTAVTLLWKQGRVCDACGAVYVRCPAGAIYLGTLATVGQPVMPVDPGPSTRPVARPLR